MTNFKTQVLNSAAAQSFVQKRLRAGESKEAAEDYALVMVGSSYQAMGRKDLADRIYAVRG